MKKEFVTYTEALALKELGFGASPIGGYQQGSIFYYEKGNLYYDGQPMYSSSYHSGQILAPLYQQVFRWFREKYSLDGWVVPYHSLKGKKYSYIIEGSDFYLEYDTEELDFDTYEGAELACLKKLIEIAKKDDN